MPSAVGAKLKLKHGVARQEVFECFENRDGAFLIDDREAHRRNPPTLWFVAETRNRRLLKVVFQNRNGKFHLLTAYEANHDEIRIYETKSKEN
ncbi:ADP-ribosyl-(dinitrogen reductase) hydrolase [Rugamonas sp. FT103W]|uniref:ADP-ribosyl-(Dinitrogen reductase) hydrolase n=1 Tax=Rugamonas rivuli TaxID=2743358 RepID=A0A843SHL5_9BURK|nr:ADP-ribosyl-(dinitrogen reductase) hydrolase [Rugamonas rivuli]